MDAQGGYLPFALEEKGATPGKFSGEIESQPKQPTASLPGESTASGNRSGLWMKKVHGVSDAVDIVVGAKNARRVLKSIEREGVLAAQAAAHHRRQAEARPLGRDPWQTQIHRLNASLSERKLALLEGDWRRAEGAAADYTQHLFQETGIRYETRFDRMTVAELRHEMRSFFPPSRLDRPETFPDELASVQDGDTHRMDEDLGSTLGLDEPSGTQGP